MSTMKRTMTEPPSSILKRRRTSRQPSAPSAATARRVSFSIPLH
jgi:hypothetical protein